MDSTSCEKWNDVPWNKLYQVSDLGSVRRMTPTKRGPAGRCLKPTADAQGYLGVNLYLQDGSPRRRRVHKLVMEAFVGPCPDGKQVNHKDGCKSNNALTNLEYVTPTGNMDHAKDAGLTLSCDKNPSCRYAPEQIREARRLYAAGVGQAEIARRFGMPTGYAWDIVHRHRWASLTDEIETA